MNFDALPRPAIPEDPLELVTGGAQPVQTAEQRLAATALLSQAVSRSNLRAQPYRLRTTFTSTGSLPSDGSWTLEDISPGRGIYRWTAQGPNYSAVNLYTTTTQGMLYSDHAGGEIPLRLEQVREALFFVQPATGPNASLRLASGYLNSAPQQCVLTEPGMLGRAPATPGRSWEEAEYCVDANTGLLTVYSPVPGEYIRYDYTAAKQFHGKIIPNGFTIAEAGRSVLEAKLESVEDPPAITDPMFQTAGLTALGVGRVMNPARRFRLTAPADRTMLQNPSRENLAVQVVVLHGNISPEGGLSETEVLASTDPSLNQTALQRAILWGGGGGNRQPGATPQSQELLFTLELVTQGR